MGDDPATGGSRGILLIQQLAALGNCHEKILSRVDKADSRTAQNKGVQRVDRNLSLSSGVQILRSLTINSHLTRERLPSIRCCISNQC